MTLAPPAPRRSTAWVQDWARLGSCATADPDTLFVQGRAQRSAKQICRGCPVIAECLADALDSRIDFGVWGGMTQRERRALLRRRPDVQSWTVLLTAVKDGEVQPMARLAAAI
ncbi:MAG: WhiB family transcriptional regulator [Tetrasphaera sp.]|nr:WhiB family transcriptional regulator [Tetrasphaera sp.]